MTIKDRIYEFVKYKNITIKKFEEDCNLSNGYVSSMRKGFGTDKLNNVLKMYPELNREWLLYGEGQMIGDAISYDAPKGTEKDYIEIIKTSQDQLCKSQEQIDRLISIIEAMTNNK